MREFADDEPEFPGSGSAAPGGRDLDVADPAPGVGLGVGMGVGMGIGMGVPHARTEPYGPVAGEPWGGVGAGGTFDPVDRYAPTDAFGMRGSFAAYAADDYADYDYADYGVGVRVGDGASGAHRGLPAQDPPGEPEFEVFRLDGTLAGAAVEPLPMLTQWFGEPARIPAAPGVEHGSPVPARQVTKHQRISHRAGPDAAGSDRRTTSSNGRSASGGREFTVALVASALVLAGLVYLHGWSRAQARADYLGFDESVLGTSGREYLVGGLRALCLPLLAMLGGLLGVRLVHSRLLAGLRRHRRSAAWCTGALRCAWFVVPGAAWFAVYRRPAFEARWWALTLPCAVTAGVLISAYGVLLARQIGAHRRDAGMGVRPWSVVLTGATVTLCLFWTSGAYANVTGRDEGKAVGHDLHRRTAVVLYSVQDLGMAADEGIEVREEFGASYRYRYTGLRLLRRSSGSLFLLPERWSWERPRLLVVHEDARLRVEYERTR